MAAEWVRGYMARYPNVRPLVLVLKGLLQQKECNDVATGGLGSFALTCMVIVHLQVSSGGWGRL